MRVNEFTPMKDIIDVMVESKPLRGMRICITGHLGRKRAEMVEIIRQCGGEFHETIKPWLTTHLLTNADWNSNSTKTSVSLKFQKAIESGVKVISEKQFYDLICNEVEEAA